MQLPPFIVTLGTLSIFQALKLWYSRFGIDPQRRYRGKGRRAVCASARASTSAAPASPMAASSLILLAGVMWYVLNHTAWGRHVYAVGDDPDAAHAVGHPGRPDADLGLCGGGRDLRLCRPGSRSAASGRSRRSRSKPSTSTRITAVVIGGTSLFGGRGSIVGSVLGAHHRGRLQHRPVAGRGGRLLADVRGGLPGHHRRRLGPMAAEGFEMTDR